jgi:hypothetical protein
MKIVRHIQAVLTIVGVVSAVPAYAQLACTNSSLVGAYSIRITGSILAGPLAGLVNGTNLTRFDGNGNLSSVDHVVVNGAVPAVAWRPAVGTYTVNPDCTGQASFTLPTPTAIHRGLPTFSFCQTTAKPLNSAGGDSPRWTSP